MSSLHLQAPTVYLVQQDILAVPQTHSCDSVKPWCRRCPKCAYVWLNYMAYLPQDVVSDMFRENLLDLPENQLAFRQMIGLEAPFECIGQIPEARLAFELCRRKGLRGQAMRSYQELPPQNWKDVIQRYCRVVSEDAHLPESVALGILPLMRSAADQARDHLYQALEL